MRDKTLEALTPRFVDPLGSFEKAIERVLAGQPRFQDVTNSWRRTLDAALPPHFPDPVGQTLKRLEAAQPRSLNLDTVLSPLGKALLEDYGRFSKSLWASFEEKAILPPEWSSLVSSRISAVTMQAILRPSQDVMLKALQPGLLDGEVLKTLVSSARRVFELPTVAPFLPSMGELAGVVASVRKVLPDPTSLLQSFESIVGLASLGKAIRFASYNPLSNEALRTLLGNWTSTGLPPSIFSDWQARRQFYADLGFDGRLTALPEPAFTESLYGTGILRHDLFQPLPPLVLPPVPQALPEEPCEDGEEQDWVGQRMQDAYYLLFSFETQLRDYIDQVMTEQFGPHWYARRVPAQLVKVWDKKRQRAMRNGEREQPIVCYADFIDYVEIITRSDNWDQVFVHVFPNKIDVQVSLQRLHPIRVCTMHSRVLTKADFLLLSVEVHRILRAIGRLDDDEER